VGRQGDCPETEWPYVIARFKTRPSAKCYAERGNTGPFCISADADSQPVKGCLASGYPFVFDSRFMKVLKARKWPGPACVAAQIRRAGPLAAMPLPGRYNDAKQWFVVRTLGRPMGMKGYFTLPYS